MAILKQLDSGVFVSGQIEAADVAAAAARGVGHIVCNRPDGEDEGQPAAAEVARWAEAAGLAFHHIPVHGNGITPEAVEAMAAHLDDAAAAPLLAYCRSGGRSAALWALAAAFTGRHPPERILGLAHNAGYDLASLAPVLARLANHGLG
ncbi:MAG: TIGR01244 family sulfur transferase [Rhodothalassiaceae bacterium]